MLNGRKRTALVDVFAARLVVDGVFVRCSYKLCRNAGTSLKCAAFRSYGGWAQMEAVRLKMGNVKHYTI